jgi:hypothetical protein
MGVVEWIVLAILGLLAASLRKLLTDELKAWLPSLIEMILLFAVKKAPVSLRDRYAEEWRAHLNEIPGELTKLSAALGFVCATRKMNAAIGQLDTESAEAPGDDPLTVTIVRSLTLDDLKALANSRVEPPRCPDPWPPLCNSASDGKHEVPGAALYISTRYGVHTFQGPCTLCRQWVDTGEIFD